MLALAASFCGTTNSTELAAQAQRLELDWTRNASFFHLSIYGVPIIQRFDSLEATGTDNLLTESAKYLGNLESSFLDAMIGLADVLDLDLRSDLQRQLTIGDDLGYEFLGFYMIASVAMAILTTILLGCLLCFNRVRGNADETRELAFGLFSQMLGLGYTVCCTSYINIGLICMSESAEAGVGLKLSVFAPFYLIGRIMSPFFLGVFPNVVALSLVVVPLIWSLYFLAQDTIHDQQRARGARGQRQGACAGGALCSRWARPTSVKVHKAIDVYEDLSRPTMWVFTFLVQLTLVFYFGNSIEETNIVWTGKVQMKWICGILFQILMGYKLVPDLYEEMQNWEKILSYETDEITYKNLDEECRLKFGEVSRCLLRARLVCSVVANIWIPVIIIIAVPLVLATAENDMEFVLNAFAATYIVNLDDLRDGTEITLTPATRYTELADDEEAEGRASGANDVPSLVHV